MPAMQLYINKTPG